MKNFAPLSLSTRALSLHPPAMHPAGGSAKRERLRRATKEGGAAGPESRAANKQSAPGDSGKIHANPCVVCAGLGKKRN